MHFEQRQSKWYFVDFLVVAVYVTLLSFSASNLIFPADDALEYDFVNGMDSFWKCFGVDSFGLFRPIKNILFYFFSYGLGSVVLSRLISIIAGILAYLCVRRLFQQLYGFSALAVAASAIWILSPTLVSSVAWLSCVNIQLMNAFAAMALFCHSRARRWDVVWASILLSLALISYENAVIVGPLAMAIDYFLAPERISKRSTWLNYGVYAGITVIYLLLRHAFGSTSSVSGSFDGVSRLGMMAASAYFTLFHFLTWLWPFGRFQVFGNYSQGSVSLFVLIGCWCVVVGMVLGAFALRKVRPRLALGLAFSLIGFLPVSNLLGLGNGPYGDYYLGLSSLGLVLVILDFVEMAFNVSGPRRSFGVALVAGLSVWRLAAGVETARWAALWGDGEVAFEESVRNFPNSFSNYQMLATIRFNRGDYCCAMSACRQTEQLLSPNTSQRMVLFQIRALVALSQDKDFDQAMRMLDQTLAVARPKIFDADYHFYRGCAFEDLRHDDVQAKAEYEKSLSLRFDADSMGAVNRLVKMMLKEGDAAGARTLWARAREIAPKSERLMSFPE